MLTVNFFFLQQTNKYKEKRGHGRLPTLTSASLRPTDKNSSTSWIGGIFQGQRSKGQDGGSQSVNRRRSTQTGSERTGHTQVQIDI